MKNLTETHGRFDQDGNWIPPTRTSYRSKDEQTTHHKRHYSKEYSRNRAYVLRRDMALCVICQDFFDRLSDGSECDHARPVSDQGTSTADNLWFLCKSCHGRKTQHEAHGRYPYQFGWDVKGNPITLTYDDMHRVIAKRNQEYEAKLIQQVSV